MLHDLSQPIANGIFHSKRYPPPTLSRLSTLDNDGVNVTHAAFAVHTGTHVDAPSHFLEDGESITDIPVERFVGRGLFVTVDRGPREEIQADDLAAALEKAGPDTMLCLRTGWDTKFTDAEVYRQYPYLSLHAAKALVDVGIRMIALDTPSPDLPEGGRPPGFDWPVHRILMRGGVLITEQLRGLDQLEGAGEFQLSAIPIALTGSDGAPARVIAETAG